MSQDETMLARIESQTGRPLREWFTVLEAAGLDKHGEMVGLLKGEGVTHGYANSIVHEFRNRAADAPTGDEALVDAQYQGKEEMRPLYDALLDRVRAFGDDVEVAPKKSYVSLRRSKQFGLVQPSTKTRLDVGIKLRDLEPDGRLEASGSFNQMVSHRVRVTRATDIDEQLVGWLRRAYEEA